jgi:hypothetical protein
MEANNNWNKIFILDEFLTYFRAYELKNFSLISKFVRNKLKLKLFSNTTLTSKNIIRRFNPNTFNDNELANIFDYFEYWNNSYSYKRFKDKWEAQLSNNSGLSALKQYLGEDLVDIGKYIRNLNVNRFYYSFYFLSPIVFDLSNLTQLSLNECAFPLLMLLKIGEHLKKLKILNLDLVDLVGLSKQELSPEDVCLPHNLEELSIDCCRVYNMYSVPNTLSLVQHRWSHIHDDLVHLRGLKIPNLKKLTLDLVDDSEFSLRLLKLNPQVEELRIGSDNMTQDVSDLISTRDNLTNITIYSDESFPYISEDANLKIPNFNHINQLKLHFRCTDDPNVHHRQSITKYFPNLTQLALELSDLEYDNFNMNEFVRVNLSCINRLDKFILEIKDSDNYYYEFYFSIFGKFKFDWFNFINVNCLILDIDILTISAVDFEALPHGLKEIRVPYGDKPTSLDYIKNNRNIFKYWKFEFKKDFIYFSK